jgi:uncharacterized membrane protein
MTAYFLIYLHVLGAIVILGTGISIAFFMLMAISAVTEHSSRARQLQS